MAQLLHGIKTGEVPFLKAHGVSYFEYLDKHAEEFAIFSESMTSMSSTENPAIAAAYKFAGIRKLVDLGGGHGTLLATILRASPKLKGVLFDQPSDGTRAKQDQQLTAKGVGERYTVETGDFFEAVGGDAYIAVNYLLDSDIFCRFEKLTLSSQIVSSIFQSGFRSKTMCETQGLV